MQEYHELLRQKKDKSGSDNQRDANNVGSNSGKNSEFLDQEGSSNNITESIFQPFLIINSIEPNSPSYAANLQIYDKIIKYGEIEADNFLGLGQIGEYTKKNENQAITVGFIRESEGSYVQMTVLKPQRWSGRGLLGCVINTVE